MTFYFNEVRRRVSVTFLPTRTQQIGLFIALTVLALVAIARTF